MLRWRIYSCRWTCTWCSAGGSLLLPLNILFDAPLEDLFSCRWTCIDAPLEDLYSCLAVEHVLDAPLEDLYSCRWTCTWCSAGGSTLAVEHVLDAPLEDLLLPLNTYLMLRWKLFQWTALGFLMPDAPKKNLSVKLWRFIKIVEEPHGCHDFEQLCWFCPTPTSIFACSFELANSKQDEKSMTFPVILMIGNIKFHWWIHTCAKCERKT